MQLAVIIINIRHYWFDPGLFSQVGAFKIKPSGKAQTFSDKHIFILLNINPYNTENSKAHPLD
jgi:hypothetical protein